MGGNALAASSESANQAHWENVGASYRAEWESPGKQLLSEKELAFVARHVPSGARAGLDVGTGNGRILDRLLTAAPAAELYGVDVAQAMLDACRARFAGEPRVVDLQLCDVSQQPLPFDRQFDFISAIRVLKYSPAWKQSVARLAASLEGGGTIVFTMPNRASVNRLSRAYAVPWYQSSEAELRTVCADAGLRVVDMAGFARLPYVAYRRAPDGLPVRALLGAEGLAERVLGRTRLARELFVAAIRT